jgi:hypothetical protein
VYEAVRASPLWEKTLLVVTYDEHGGFWDRVVPPKAPPPGDGEPSYTDVGFKFDRLGVRIPTILISPWIPKGTIVGAPPPQQRPFPDSEFDLTSIISTSRKLLGLKNAEPLTARDKWSATFEHVLSLQQPRKDCPLHMPDPLPPAHDPSLEGRPPAASGLLREASLPLNDLQRDIATVTQFLGNLHSAHTAHSSSSSSNARSSRSRSKDRLAGTSMHPTGDVWKEELDRRTQGEHVRHLRSHVAAHLRSSREWVRAKLKEAERRAGVAQAHIAGGYHSTSTSTSTSTSQSTSQSTRAGAHPEAQVVVVVPKPAFYGALDASGWCLNGLAHGNHVSDGKTCETITSTLFSSYGTVVTLSSRQVPSAQTYEFFYFFFSLLSSLFSLLLGSVHSFCVWRDLRKRSYTKSDQHT